MAVLALLTAPPTAEAQARVHRVGVVLQGGDYAAAIDGLRDGLKRLAFEEGKQYVLHVREAKGDSKSVEAAARALEAEKVDLIYALATSVTLATKRATKRVPIVFYAGTDPVTFGLVDSFRKPGGRLTGIHGRFTGLAVSAKRLQLLKEAIPGLRRVVTFYGSDNPVAREAVKLTRDAALQLNVELMERPVASVEELRGNLHALQRGDADAFLYVADAMVASQAKLVIDIAMTKQLPVMFSERETAVKGALASYGVSYYVIGQLSAGKVQRVLQGADPGSLPIEQIDRVHFAVNLKTAKALGIAIPQSVLTRADEIIQ